MDAPPSFGFVPAGSDERWLRSGCALVIAQLLFYGMAAVGPKGGRLAGVARTFVVLNVAAVVGLGRFLTGRQRITWKTGRESGSAAASEGAASDVQVSSGPTKS